MDKSVLWRQVKGILDNLSAGLKRLEKKIETAGGGADWNANEGEPGHILNKPFGDKTVVTVFPETTIPFNEDASGWVTNVPVTIPPEGTECTVTINGTAHEAALKMLSLEGLSAPVLGNASVLGGEDTGETFFIMMVPPEKSEMAGGMTMQMVLFDGSTDAATVSIEAVSVKKIAYEFMPDGYPRIETSSGVILPETAIIRTGLMDGASEPLKGDIVVGKTYTVNISGTEYQTEAKNAYFAVHWHGHWPLHHAPHPRSTPRRSPHRHGVPQLSRSFRCRNRHRSPFQFPLIRQIPPLFHTTLRFARD